MQPPLVPAIAQVRVLAHRVDLQQCSYYCCLRVFDCSLALGAVAACGGGGRCICNPLWAHSGLNCDEPSWTSLALAGVLGTVSVFSVSVLASAAKMLSTTPSRCGSGVLQLARMLLQRQEEEGARAKYGRVNRVHRDKTQDVSAGSGRFSSNRGRR